MSSITGVGAGNVPQPEQGISDLAGLTEDKKWDKINEGLKTDFLSNTSAAQSKADDTFSEFNELNSGGKI